MSLVSSQKTPRLMGAGLMYVDDSGSSAVRCVFPTPDFGTGFGS